MQNSCQNCGSKKLHIDGEYYICDFCGEEILKESLDELVKNDSKFVDDYISRNEKLFSINFNDDTLTKDDLYKLADELRQSIDEQQDENSKIFKEGILADIYDKISEITPKKAESTEKAKDDSDFISKVNECSDLDDLFEKGNTIRKKIEKSFYKAGFKGQPLFEKVNGTPAITKERYLEFIDSLLSERKINESDARFYKSKLDRNQLGIIYKDPLNRVVADVPIRFMGAGLKFSEIPEVCKDWNLLNACSHEGAEDDPKVKEVLLPIEKGEEYLKNLYYFYKDRNLID